MERKRNNTIRLVIKTHPCCSVSFFFMLSIFIIIFTTTSTASTITCLDSTKCSMLAKADIDFQEIKEEIAQGMVSEGNIEVSPKGWFRRVLRGPGSSPPQCTSKCGKCRPCKLVLIQLDPRTPFPYSPEVWRCKCGNKL